MAAIRWICNRCEASHQFPCVQPDDVRGFEAIFSRCRVKGCDGWLIKTRVDPLPYTHTILEEMVMAKKANATAAVEDEAVEEEWVEIPPDDPRPVETKAPDWVDDDSDGQPQLEVNGVDAVQEMMNGVSIADISHRTGVKRSKLRRMLVKAFGGKEAYNEARDAIRSTANSENHGEKVTRLQEMDADVPRIKGTRIEDGWTSEAIWVNRGGKRLEGAPIYDPHVSESLFISPDGTRYVVAADSEKADLIVEANDYEGLGEIRLRIFETSKIYRLVEQGKELQRQAIESMKARKEKKRAQRKAKK